MDGLTVPNLRERISEFLDLAWLNESEQKAMVFLLFEGVSSLARIATGAHIPKNKAYEILEGLERQGLVFQPSALNKTKQYRAVRPEEMFNLLLRGPHRMDLIRTETEGRLVEMYEGAEEGSEEANIEAYIEVTDNKAAVNSKLLGAIKASHKEVLVFGHDLNWVCESTTLMGQLRAQAEAGVEVRVLFDGTRHESRDAQVTAFSDAGFEVRTTPTLRSPMVIIDRRNVYMGIRKPTPKATEFSELFIRITSEDLAADMLRAYNEAWENAQRVGASE